MCKKKRHVEKKEEKYPPKVLRDAWKAINDWQDKHGKVSLSEICLKSKQK